MTAQSATSGPCTFGSVEYAHAERRHVHLRTCAWLDACSHAPVWWTGHRRRAFYAAAVRAYHVVTADASRNRVIWCHAKAESASGSSGVGLYDASLRCLVRIDGGTNGFFELGWLEGRRAQRHRYEVRWEEPSAM